MLVLLYFTWQKYRSQLVGWLVVGSVCHVVSQKEGLNKSVHGCGTNSEID